MPNPRQPARSLTGQPAGPKPSATPPADVMKVFRQLLVPPGVYIVQARALGEPSGPIPYHPVPSCAILTHVISRQHATRILTPSHLISTGWKGTMPGTSTGHRGTAPIVWLLTYSALAYVDECEHCSRIDRRRCIGTLSRTSMMTGARGRPSSRMPRVCARVRLCVGID